MGIPILPRGDEGLTKYCSWGAWYQDGHVQVPHVRKIATNGARFAKVAKFECKDTAELIRQFLEEYQVKLGHTYLLDTALGAYEAWGANNNGDAFREVDLMVDSDDHGYRSFKKHAHVFRHHCNSDPSKAIGKVVLSAYNRDMKRVELIEEMDNFKGADLLQKWENEGSLPSSMGCKVAYDVCLPMGVPVVTPDGVKPIETVEVGDDVFTAEGGIGEVTNLFRRKFTGTMVTLDVRGVAQAMPMTENHPVLVVREAAVRGCRGSANGRGRRHSYEGGKCKMCGSAITDLKPEYVEAESVQVGDYVVIPRVSGEPHGEGLDVQLAQLCGYYLGDGSLTWRRDGRDRSGPRKCDGFNISCHADEKEHIARVVSLIEGMTEKGVHVYEAGAGRNAVQIVCHDPVLGAELMCLCGHTQGKHLPRRIFSSCAESKLALLAGLIDTDGHVAKDDGAIRYVTTLASLGFGSQLLGISLGLPISMSRREATSSWARAGTQVFQICVGGEAAEALKQYSVKCLAWAGNRRWTTQVVGERWVLAAVTGVLHEDVEGIEVFNFSVAGDESYLVANVGVHNCSICNNRAPSARQYCDHAKYAMNQVWDDGRKICVWNPNPKFFDQSHVLIPAEKIAGTMMKVASANDLQVDVEEPAVVPSAIAGELRNVIEIEEPAVKVASQAFEISDAQVLAELDPEFPLEVLQALTAYPIHKVASTLTFLGIVPKPEEWQYLSLAAQGNEDAALAFHKAGICFDPDVEVPALQEDEKSFIQPHFADTKIASLIGEYVPQRSVFPQFLGSRIEAFEKGATKRILIEGIPGNTKGEARYSDPGLHRKALRENLAYRKAWAARSKKKTAAEVTLPEKIRKGEPSIPATMLALGVSYGLVRAIQGSNSETLLGIKKSLGTEPIISALLIAAGAAAAMRMGASFFNGEKPDEKAKVKLSSLLDGHRYGSCTTTPWGGKVAASKGLGSWMAETPESVKSIVLPFGLGYMSSAYYRAKQMQGQPTTSTQNVIADHPLAAGVAGVGAVAAVRKALKR